MNASNLISLCIGLQHRSEWEWKENVWRQLTGEVRGGRRSQQTCDQVWARERGGMGGSRRKWKKKTKQEQDRKIALKRRANTAHVIWKSKKKMPKLSKFETHLNTAFIFMNFYKFKIAFNCNIQTSVKSNFATSTSSGWMWNFLLFFPQI